MKKQIALLLTVVLLLCLSACGANTPAPTPTAEPTAAAAEPTSATTPGVTAETPSPEETAAEPTALELAMACIDGSVEELYAAIGEPIDSDYIPSCLHPNSGGEDGELVYDGFRVYTYRDANGEIVYDVLADE